MGYWQQNVYSRQISVESLSVNGITGFPSPIQSEKPSYKNRVYANKVNYALRYKFLETSSI